MRMCRIAVVIPNRYAHELNGFDGSSCMVYGIDQRCIQ